VKRGDQTDRQTIFSMHRQAENSLATIPDIEALRPHKFWSDHK
jgi:hypothetical protein